MSAMDEMREGSAPAAGGRARSVAPIHLPTWSRLDVAAKQSAPAGSGGDFFEVIQQRDGRVAIIVADVCGNGPSAAAPVSGLRWILRQAIARGAAPGAVLAALNDWMCERPVDDRFVTAVCARVDAVSGLVEIASAGHLGPFVKRADGTAEDLPRAAGLALGIFPGQLYPETTVEIGPQDAMVLVTDGITDRLATAGDQLGQGALLERLARARLGPESICSALLGPEARATEDATVLVVQMPRRHRRATPLARAG
ncbi:MAG TPA: PP2C family protein-serine/threonine phosphatase [Polyangia bacterium]|nr:PP2C family protein-serine/threonine phosphatase [Polyangia bacterium]